MKTILTALLFLSAFTASAKSFAASSICEVFISSSDDGEKRYETVTTCDGKQGAIVKFDDMTVGTVGPLTNAVHVLLEKGYTLLNCSGTGVNTACYLTK